MKKRSHATKRGFSRGFRLNPSQPLISLMAGEISLEVSTTIHVLISCLYMFLKWLYACLLMRPANKFFKTLITKCFGEGDKSLKYNIKSIIKVAFHHYSIKLE